jgi:WhiB family redox-sensing transcriptional regulator
VDAIAKALCGRCLLRDDCLAGAIERQEFAGVWGGQIFDNGEIVTYKRRRGRPRKNSTPPQRITLTMLGELPEATRRAG